MYLVKSQIIKGSKELDHHSRRCKNLYNRANYIIRQNYIDNNEKYHTFYDMCALMKTDFDYISIGNARVARSILRILDANWKAFFEIRDKYISNPELFKGKPNIPGYLEKKGKFTSIFYESAIHKPKKDQDYITLSILKSLKIYTDISYEDIKEIQLIPLINGDYKINITYLFKEKQKEDNLRYAGIDLGLNNLITLTSNTGSKPLIVNGRPIKSINQLFNKNLANLKSNLPKGKKINIDKQDKDLPLHLLYKYKDDKEKDVYTSNKIKHLCYKRNNRINDHLHKSSKLVINYLLQNNINTLILGYNKNWKQSISLGKKNNQNFVSIPFHKLVFMLEYKCKMYGINLIRVNEAYTSKCSFLDNEDICNHDLYKGKRIKRGLFQTNKQLPNGKLLLINADVNAAYNMIKKVKPNAFIAIGIEGLPVSPIKINII